MDWNRDTRWRFSENTGIREEQWAKAPAAQLGPDKE